MGDVGAEFEIVVVEAVGERRERQALCCWGLLGVVHAAGGGDGGGEGDINVKVYESLGELEGRVYVSLGREAYEKEVGVSHLKPLWLIGLFLFFGKDLFIGIKYEGRFMLFCIQE